MCSKVLLNFFKRSWDLPNGVPSDVDRFLAETKVAKLRWLLKYIKRRLFSFLFAEFFGFIPERKKILPSHKRILWINWAAPSLGDSLMDLSSRVLLKNRQVTLLTNPKNACLYLNDEWFTGVYSDPRVLVSEVGRNAFDLVICDSFAPRVLIRKLYVAPIVEFCGLYGYLNGFEVHRTLFSFFRMRDLLSVTLNNVSLRPCITIEPDPELLNKYDVCLAIGGEWGFRTYAHWCEVVIQLEGMGLSVVLVGSENGMLMSNSILEICPSITSTVGHLDLNEVVKLIANCTLFVGADGGLWHIASSIPVPTLVLFADCQIFQSDGSRVTRETSDMDCVSLYDCSCVSNISPNEIVKNIRIFFNIDRAKHVN